jgi:hypothetical protein
MQYNIVIKIIVYMPRNVAYLFFQSLMLRSLMNGKRAILVTIGVVGLDSLSFVIHHNPSNLNINVNV